MDAQQLQLGFLVMELIACLLSHSIANASKSNEVKQVTCIINYFFIFAVLQSFSAS